MHPMISFVLRIAFLYFIMNFFKGNQSGQSTGGATVAQTVPIWSRGEPVDFYVYISEQSDLQDRSSAQLVWEQKSVPLATGNPELLLETTYTPSEVGLRTRRASDFYV